MGVFYTNVVLKGPSQAALARHIAHLEREVFIAPTVGGITAVYDRACEDQDETVLEGLGAYLSNWFWCPALVSLVHDGSLYQYWLYNKGARLDAYNAFPNYFDETQPAAPTGGDAARLCATFAVPQATDAVQRLLHPLDDADAWLDGEDLHATLVERLGWPPFTAGVGYYVAWQDDLPHGLERSALVHVG